MRVIYHRLARIDAIEAAQFYTSRREELGADFIEEVDRAVATIRKHPARWAIIHDDVRQFMLKRFPYSLHYRVVGDTLRVLVVKHHSQHPDYGTDRR